MADEEQTTPQTAPAEVSDSAESAPVTRFPDLADVLAAQDPGDVAVSNRDEPEMDADSDDGNDQAEEADDESAESQAEQQSEAQKVERLSRPAKARQEADQLRSELDQAKADLEQLRADQTKATQNAMASLGDDTRFQELHEKYEAFKKIGYEPDDYMDSTELAEYKSLLPQRLHGAALMGVAREAIRASDQSALAEAVKELNLEPKDYVGVDSATAVRKAVAATEQRVRSEWADEKARYEADTLSLATKLGGRGKTVGAGGLSDSASRHVGVAWDPNRPASENLEAALSHSNGSSG